MKTGNIFQNFKSNISGNVALIFAFALMPIMLSIGATVDYSRVTSLQTKVAMATDAALLAAASNVMEEVNLEDEAAVNARLNEIFEPFFLSNMSSINNLLYNGYTINFDMNNKKVNVQVNVDYDTAVLGIVGIEKWSANVAAATKIQMKAGGAISMFLVLDRSGSMGWSNGDGGSKMDSLQIAVDDMITNLQAADPDEQYIRIGAVAYSHYMWSVQPLKWELEKANNYVQAMWPGGGTSSTKAVKKAYKKLKKPSEQSAHMNKNGQVPELVMIFMTDGNNNNPSDDGKTIAICNDAKAFGMEVYTVAFQAPSNGQALLNNCASDSAHYFEPDNTNELIQAFQAIGASVGEKLILSQ